MSTLPAELLNLIVVSHDTIERRKGAKITEPGCYRDPVRSTRNHLVKCFGLKWLSLIGQKKKLLEFGGARLGTCAFLPISRRLIWIKSSLTG